jgi:hypothetical protein
LPYAADDRLFLKCKKNSGKRVLTATETCIRPTKLKRNPLSSGNDNGTAPHLFNLGPAFACFGDRPFPLRYS